MSFVTTQPQSLIATATALAGIGSTMSAHNAAAAAPITGVIPPAADEVSAMTVAHLATHAQNYQAVSAQAAAIHEQFVAVLMSNAHSYADTETANAVTAALGAV